MKLSILLLLLLAGLFAGGVQAETDDEAPIELIELQHRSADELLPLVEPLLGPLDALTGTGSRLIVRTSPGRLRQIRELVEALDRPTRELRLSVRVSGAADRDHFSLDPAREHEDADGRVVRRYTTARRATEQWVRVQEGQQAYIREGEVIPIAGVAGFGPDGTLIGGIDYQTLDRGFVVTPVITPDERVRLHIAQIAEREGAGGRIETQALETVTTVAPDEWVDLGGIVGQDRRDDERIIGTRRTRDRDEETVQVRIDIME